MNTFLKQVFDGEEGDYILPFLKKNIAFIGGIVLSAGLVFSPALQSIGVALVFCSVFFRTDFKWQGRASLFPVLLIAILVFCFISGLWTSNHTEYWKKIIVKLPFFMIGAAFLFGSPIKKKALFHILFFFSVMVFIAAFITLCSYMVHYSEINEQLLHSKPIYILYAVERVRNNQVNHIYFSVLLAFAAWTCFYLFQHNYGVSKLRNRLILILAFLLVILLHIIGARTGLLGFYAAAGIIVLWYIVREKKFLAGGFAILLLAGIFMTAYKFLPAWQNRVANTREDLSRMELGKDINHYSISMRKEAIKTAMQIHHRHAMLGVGEGSLQDAMDSQYAENKSNLIPENRKLPHNQFIQQLCTTGIPGVILLLWVFIFPFLRKNNWQDVLFLSFIVICFASFQVESILERQVGITFFSFFYLMLLGRKNEDTNEDTQEVFQVNP